MVTATGSPSNAYASFPTVHVRLRGPVTDAGRPAGSLPAAAEPTAEQAAQALVRAAQLAGADAVVAIGSDYRRAALAGGTLRFAEVLAWGTPIRLR